MHFHGIILGLASFLSIGLFHPVVIKCEYLFSYRIWPVFLIAGLILLAVSTGISNIILSAVLGSGRYIKSSPVQRGCFLYACQSESSSSAWKNHLPRLTGLRRKPDIGGSNIGFSADCLLNYIQHTPPAVS